MLSQLSDYHFLLNMLLIVISILQITVANELLHVRGTGLKMKRSNSLHLTPSQRMSLKTLISSSSSQIPTRAKEGDQKDQSSSPEEVINQSEGASFVDRVCSIIL